MVKRVSRVHSFSAGQKRGKTKRGFWGFFVLNYNRVAMITALWILSALAHNLIFAFYRIEEPILFALSVGVIPLYLVVAIIYTLNFCKKR